MDAEFRLCCMKRTRRSCFSIEELSRDTVSERPEYYFAATSANELRFQIYYI